jgi:hypothetical protein
MLIENRRNDKTVLALRFMGPDSHWVFMYIPGFSVSNIKKNLAKKPAGGLGGF